MMNPFGNMGLPQLQQMAQQMMKMNPNLANNPQVQNYMNVIMSGDAQKGEEIAKNLCQSFGVKPEQAVQQAQQYFMGMFNNQKPF